jgi:hypothetical protein
MIEITWNVRAYKGETAIQGEVLDGGNRHGAVFFVNLDRPPYAFPPERVLLKAMDHVERQIERQVAEWAG